MKRSILSIVVCAGILLTGGTLFPTANAQIRAKRGSAATRSSDNSKAPVSDAKRSSIQEALRARKAGELGPTDACTTRVPLILSQPMDANLTTDDCKLANGTYIDFYTFQGTAGQAISLSMVSSSFDTYLYLLDNAGVTIDENDDSGTGTNSRIPIDGGVMTLNYTGDYTIGANSYSQATGAYTLSLVTDARCTTAPVTYNQPVNGSLASTDCPVNFADQAYYTDLYTFNGVTGQQISITMTSTAVDAYLVFHTPSGVGSLGDDDSGGGTNARIPVSGMFTLAETGTYTIEVSSSGPAQVGSYTLNVTGPASAPVTVSGKVVTSDGRGLRNATVSMTNSAGTLLTTTTSSFGFFSFDNVATGDTYTFRVNSRLFRFATKTLTVVDNVTLPDFVGLE